MQYWLKWIWEKKTDYILWSDINLELLLKEKWSLNRQPVYEYNQWKQEQTWFYCTIYSAVTELSYLFDYKFTLCQILEIWDRMIKDWKLDIKAWAYLSDAIDYTRKWWNENFPDKLVSSYQIDYLDNWLVDELTHWSVRLTQMW